MVALKDKNLNFRIYFISWKFVCRVLNREVPVTTEKYRPRYATPGKSGRHIYGKSNCTEKIYMTETYLPYTSATC
jgi:hypothetical protein